MIGGRDDLDPIDLDPESDRDAWLSARMSGIGGSDAAAILGEDPHKSPIDVFLERTTGGAAMLDNERTSAGRWLEPIVLDAFARGGSDWPRLGGPLVAVKPPTVRHRVRTWQLGSADALVFEPESVADLLRIDDDDGFLEHGGILDPSSWAREISARRPQALGEVKTHGWFGSRAYDVSEDGDPLISVPGAKRIQCAWYMSLYRVDVCYLIALVDTHLRRTFVLHRDQDLEDMLLEETERFWTRHVLTGDPPPPDGTERYTRYLRDRFGKHGTDLIESTTEVDLATETLLAVKREEKRLKREKELAEQVIKNHIGENDGVRTRLGAVTWRSQSSGKIRQKEALAELYAAVGWTDGEIAEFESRHQQPDHRVLRTPSIK